MSVPENLKSQKGSMDRAVRYLTRARDAVQRGIASGSDGTPAVPNLDTLPAQLDLLQDQIKNVDSLLSQFEQLAASVDDETFKDDQTAWEDMVFECQSLHVQAKRVLLKAESSNRGDVASADDATGGSSASSSLATGSTVQNQGLNDQFSRLLTLLEQQQSTTSLRSPNSVPNGNNPIRNQFSRLPKLELPKFEGDMLEWQPFWDRFETSVDKNENLADVDKLNYLLGMLGKDPVMVIKSLPITNENYATAKSLLQAKYGDKKIVIALLYRKLNEMKPVKDDVVSLRRFVAEIDCLLGSLGSMGQSTNDDSFAAIVLSKLPNKVVVVLEICKDVDAPWTIALVRSKLADYLTRIERAAKVSAIATGKKGSSDEDFWGEEGFHAGEGPKWSDRKKKSGSQQPKPDPKTPSSNKSDKKISCVYCNGAHYSDSCDKYVNADGRFKQLNGRCSVCLNDKHRKKDCRSKKPCYFCKQVGNHHSSLCFKKFGRNQGQSGNTATEDDSEDQMSDEKTADGSGPVLLAAGESVALQTAQIPVKCDGGTGSFSVTRALFDPGANRSYCSDDLARKLSMKLEKGPQLRVNRFGAGGPVNVPTKKGKLRVRKLDGSTTMIEVSVIPKITGNLSRIPIRSQKLEKLQARVKFADSVPKKQEASPIDFLIGNDYYLDFITGEKIEVESGLYLLGSEFGYIVSGRSPTVKKDGYPMSMCGITCGSLEGLDDIVALPKADGAELKKPEMSDFWSLETLGIKDNPEVTSDDLAAENFRQNVHFTKGRYSVSLPWNERTPELTNNYMLSVGRLGSLVKKLKNNDDLFDKYDGIIQDQLEKGVIEKIDSAVPVVRKHYIPHHAVVTPQKETTKVRIVYDGSAKTFKGAPSLNECLHRGPILLEDLAGLLIRFRTHKVAIVADIEKAFLQIGINSADRDMLRFLWLKDPKLKTVDNNLEEYRFSRVLFGLNCSPSLLSQTVDYHLAQVRSKAAVKLRKDLYVDNVITGSETTADAIQFYQEAKEIFRSASMNLREWMSNSADLMEKVAEKDKLKGTKNLKVLGLRWDTDKDCLSIAPNSKLPQPCETKREFLSQLSAIFDPLGFFSPSTLEAKVLLQEACRSKPKWDSKLPNEVVAKWEAQQKLLSMIPDRPIPRYIPTNGQCLLIAFSDASTKAYATAIYLRSENGDNVSVNLLMSKSRLNPEKKMSIPRLELMGILIGVRALAFAKAQLKMPECKAILFSDSSCALAWVKSRKKLDLFVKNRIAEIAKSSDWITFRYVATDHNPADWATRGKSVPELSDFWWNGPLWLQKPLSGWKTWVLPETGDPKPEAPPQPLHDMSMIGATGNPKFPIPVEKFSTHLKLIRVTAWCLRFIEKLRKKKDHAPRLSAEEVSSAEKRWELWVQSEAYSEIQQKLKNSTSCNLGQLRVFKDPDGFLRCKARLEKADLAWEVRNPKILPKSHYYTKLLVERIHKDNGHASAAHTLNLLRKKYWVPKGRQLVKSVCHRCVACKKAIGQPYALPEMPELPPDRVVPQPCFSSTGVDYFGPLRLKGPSGTEKAWVALFTCLTTRAVHLELVQDMSADEFLMALRRFIARRGKPTSMLSDNATQFKAVARAVDLAWEKVLQDPTILDFSAREGIKWSFIVEFAPYMGGVYERLVGVVKTCLKKTLGSALLSPKQFETLLFECESIVNTRPLAYVASDVDDGTVLTPAHFLSLNPRIAIPDMPKQLKKDSDFYRLETFTLESLIEKWKKGQNLLDEFWARWKTEYLTTLREQMSYRHKKNRGKTTLPKLGEIVLLKEAMLPRGAWRIAKVAQVHVAKDGKIRSVSVDLPSGRRLNRPINLIIPLEVWSEDHIPATDAQDEESDSESHSSGRVSPELVAQDS